MIVEKYDGRIDFKSTYKKGTTFFFTFEHVAYTNEELRLVD